MDWLRIKAAELRAHLEKLQKCKQQRDALSEQIKIHHQQKDDEKSTPQENPYARSESLMALYQREKAKQLYQEQLAIVKQRENYLKKIGEIEKRHSLERLTVARKEYYKLI